jgi:hypothetical protein
MAAYKDAVRGAIVMTRYCSLLLFCFVFYLVFFCVASLFCRRASVLSIRFGLFLILLSSRARGHRKSQLVEVGFLTIRDSAK